MSRIARTLAKDWDELVEAIPDDLEASAKEHNAVRRHRGIKSAADLLRLILIYVTVLSLLTTVLWGVGLNLCDLSRQAIGKRILHSTAWLRYLVAVLVKDWRMPDCKRATWLWPIMPTASGARFRWP